jgi:hypothetical protein
MLIYTKRALPCNNNLNLRRRSTAKECCGDQRNYIYSIRRDGERACRQQG